MKNPSPARNSRDPLREAQTGRQGATASSSAQTLFIDDQILDQFPDAVFIHQAGTIVYANPLMAAWHGAGSAAQLVGMNSLDLVFPEDHALILSRRREVSNGPLSESLAHRRLRLDGGQFDARTRSSEVTWQGKRSTLVVVRDSQLQAKDRDALLESDERYRHLAELSPDGILVDTDGINMFANAGLARILGAESPNDLIGKQSIDMIPLEHREEVFTRRKMVKAGQNIQLAEGQVFRLDGSRVNVESVMTRITWQGKPSCLVLIRDIRERKRAETAIEEQRVLFETVMNSMDLALAAWDRDLNLITWNRKWEEEHKFPEGFLRPGNRYEDIQRWNVETGGGDTDDLEARIARHLSYVRQGIEPEPVVERPDGTIVLRKRHPLPDGGFVTTRADITMLTNTLTRIEEQGKELEKMAINSEQARQEAQTANQAKSEFLAMMSHELRTPLNAILGFSEIISTEAFGPMGVKKYGEYAKDIYNSGQHLLELTNDILDLSKVESGNDEIFDEEIRVSELLFQLSPLIAGRAGHGGVALRYDCPEGLPALRADRRKLKQILLNLLSNAVKFTLAGGDVMLKVTCSPDRGHIFQIIDSGVGIADKDIPKAMAPFRQVESGLNRKIEGTGLGLPLSKALVELHGGSLELESEVGVGTTVTVRFPVERAVFSV